jgi:phenylalanyl-tRNA synthetase alpha chain
MFGKSKIRLRPSYFPLLQSLVPRLAIHWGLSKWKPIIELLKETGWLEIGGCGMVDPNV